MLYSPESVKWKNLIFGREQSITRSPLSHPLSLTVTRTAESLEELVSPAAFVVNESVVPGDLSSAVGFLIVVFNVLSSAPIHDDPSPVLTASFEEVAPTEVIRCFTPLLTCDRGVYVGSGVTMVSVNTFLTC